VNLTKTERLLRAALISIADTAGFDGETYTADGHVECVSQAAAALDKFRKLHKAPKFDVTDEWD
jgi:hypothetical protein